MNSTHLFPGPYTFKAIGLVDEDFAARIVAAAQIDVVQGLTSSLRHSTDGRYVAVTIQVRVPTAEVVVDLYQRLAAVQGLKMLL